MKPTTTTATIVASRKPQTNKKTVYEVWVQEDGDWEYGYDFSKLTPAREYAEGQPTPTHIVKIVLPAI